MIGKIALAGVLAASVLTANVKPAEAQIGVWLGRAAWVAVGAAGYGLWERYHYGNGGFGYGPPRYSYYGPPPWSRGYYYGPPYPPRYAYGGYYGPPPGYYGY
jgi:hypothetical protein